MCGKEQPGEEKFWIYPRRGRVGEKKFKNFLAGASLISPKCTNSCQNAPKWANFLPWRGKYHSDSSPGHWRGKIWFSDPRNSRKTPPRPAIPRQRLSWGKNARPYRHLWSEFQTTGVCSVSQKELSNHDGDAFSHFTRANCAFILFSANLEFQFLMNWFFLFAIEVQLKMQKGTHDTKCSDKCLEYKFYNASGQWWWLSWLSSCFQHQRSAVRIPTSSKFYLPIVHLNRKDKNKEKEVGKGPTCFQPFPMEELLQNWWIPTIFIQMYLFKIWVFPLFGFIVSFVVVHC